MFILFYFECFEININKLRKCFPVFNIFLLKLTIISASHPLGHIKHTFYDFVRVCLIKIYGIT